MTTEWEASDLMKKAENLVDKSEWALAEKFIKRILSKEPDNIQALKMQASINIELGDVDSAKSILKKCIQICPDDHASYLSLGQFEDGPCAKEMYQKAYDLTNDPKTKAEVCCAIAELYMTDLCDDADAEIHCEDKIKEATEIQPNNLNVLKVQADFLLCQEQIEKAKETLEKAFNIIMDQIDDNVEELYETRLTFGRLMIEIGMFEQAMDIFDMLLNENDQVIETWYLLGLACSQCIHNEDAEQKLELTEDAIESFTFALGLSLKAHDTEYEEEIINQLKELDVDTDALVHTLKVENNLIK